MFEHIVYGKREAAVNQTPIKQQQAEEEQKK